MNNYKVYAESHKQYSTMKVELNNIRNDYNHNYGIMKTDQEFIK